MCRVGGIRSYSSKRVASIGEHLRGPFASSEATSNWAMSSASTLGRFESDDDFQGAEFRLLVERLQPAVDRTHRAALNWIADRHLDAVVVFNGRIDATRAVYEAALCHAIPVVSLERTWFGDGLQLLPQENCLGLRSVNRLVAEWSDRPLTVEQSKRGASHIAARFLQRNQNEWRSYNIGAELTPWPSRGEKHKILLIPGSLNEIWGHADWRSGWHHPIDAYDALIEHFDLKPRDLVLRCHPNWSENIGKEDGHRAEAHYTSWARKRGIVVIPSSSRTSTLGLIEQADTVVVASGSAGLEAGALGKQVIGIAPSNYQKAGIREDACDIDRLRSLRLWADYADSALELAKETVRRNTLRFSYAISHRVPQYVDYVRAQTPTRFLYRPGADPERFISLLQSGSLAADDSTFATDCSEESETLQLLREKRWADLIRSSTEAPGLSAIKRRFPYTGIDGLRGWMRHGDR